MRGVLGVGVGGRMGVREVDEVESGGGDVR